MSDSFRPWTAVWWRCVVVGFVAPVVIAGDAPLISGAVSLDGGLVMDERPRAGGGSIDGDWQLAEARLFLRPHAAVRIGLGLGANREAYHTVGLEHDLTDEVHYAWLRVPIAMMVQPHWGVTVQGSFGSGYGGGASTSDGRQWQIQGGPIYRRDEDLIVGLLVNVSSRIDGQPSIFPFPSLYWRFQQDWYLTVVDDIDNLSTLRWALREQLDLGLRVDVRLREAATSSERVLSDEHIAASCQATWMPGGRGATEFTVFMGAQVMRRLAERDDHGDEQWSVITRPAPLIGLNLRGSF